ncbi:(Fe-S)-binding protein [Dichotomicrobium thermohalophilum]|uniref:L-lactate dehydrogenase complex protein LldE n=1 Tax=Dichotomicrobium thermohalophilum TaxID=933063 RepID=A0A397Q6S0_9HYPH|nr:(Fe-S)-binding protein [Dichotomicrobium thermohalophilum]RIA56782.1 L-lactate dehydrogenase complex protein LldE [Dichotomicrobium thermohalophilum]
MTTLDIGKTSRTVPESPHVALFATCLVDLFRPVVGFAAVKLLEEAGCRVEVPDAQTCCGQPAYNSGDRADASAIARKVIEAFEPYDFIVVPSGSCGGMLKKHYPVLFHDDPDMRLRAARFGAKTYELIAFLRDVMQIDVVNARHEGAVTYHDSCSSLRENGIKQQPRELLESVDGLELREAKDSEVCCGFGGLFSVKYPNISNSMVSDKVDRLTETGAPLVLSGDLGCLLNIAGKAAREGRPLEARHIAEVLADMTDEPPIAGARE